MAKTFPPKCFFTKVSRVAGTNADCNVIEEEEETPETPSGGVVLVIVIVNINHVHA